MSEPDRRPPADTAATGAAPRVVKRYGNRKLYDVRTSTYVALEDLATLVRAGETLQVVDNATGEDITAQTLTQVILEEGKRGPAVLPADLLHTVLRRGGRALDAGREAVDHLRHGVDDLVQQSLGRLTRLLPVARHDELEQLRRQLADVERSLGVLLERQPKNGTAPQQDGATPTPPAQDPGA